MGVRHPTEDVAQVRHRQAIASNSKPSAAVEISPFLSR